MNRSKLKTYAPKARREFIQTVTDRAAFYGLTKKKIEPVKVQGDVAVIRGTAFPKLVAEQRSRLEERISREGFEQVMEAIAYTWFNRFVAIRYMELHGYLDHGYRVLSHPEGKSTPEIVEHAEHVTLTGLDRQRVVDLKLDGTKDEELYRLLLIAQCNALNSAMPFLFERVHGESELLLPDNLLHSDSLIRKLVTEIDETDWQEVEIIGWLYQFYISEKKDQVIGKVVKSEDIPAATQLFTPNWIVKYLVQNSIGRQWLATYPDSLLKAKMEYYIEPAEQTSEVQAQLDAITPKSLNPEEMTLLDPACGSGHILVEAYDLFKVIYQERGYRAKDIPRLILCNNLFGLEIDDRAAQLASFALIMKARADDRRVLENTVSLNVRSIQSSDGLNADAVFEAITGEEPEPLPPGVEFDFMEEVKTPLLTQSRRSRTPTSAHIEFTVDDIRGLLTLFKSHDARLFGSLIRIPDYLATLLPQIARQANSISQSHDLNRQQLCDRLAPIVAQALMLGQHYDAVVANPPYMASLFGALKTLATSQYSASRPDLFAMFMERCFKLVAVHGCMAMVTMHSWMFLKSFAQLRHDVLHDWTIGTMAHLGPRAFPEISGEVVQTTAFALLKHPLSAFRPTFFRLVEGESDTKQHHLLAREASHNRMVASDFDKIPGAPLAYWISEQAAAVFERATLLGDIAEPRKGMVTSDNPRFIRYWHEVSLSKIGFGCRSRDEAKQSSSKWFPYQKGGEYRRWYGNVDSVVNWENDGYVLLHLKDEGYDVGSTNHNLDYIFKPALVWTKITSTPNFRYSPEGFLFDDASGLCPVREEPYVMPILGLLNSPVTPYYLNAFNPTLNLNPGNLVNVPVLPEIAEISLQVQELVDLARQDWTARESSWGFSTSPLVLADRSTVREAINAVIDDTQRARERLIQLEKEVHGCLVRAYNLGGELSSSEDGGATTIQESTRKLESQRLMSFAIGCMLGRYSLDEPGLIYAHGGNEGCNFSRHEVFVPDDDGVVPVTDFEWFDDDVTNRFVEFVGVAWPKDHLEENLKFVAESLGVKRGEQPRDAIRRYLANDFYKDHLQAYKRRPIYWLFSSGREKAFQTLVYLHRYNEGTLSRMRTEYVIPLQGKLSARIGHLEEEIGSATSTSHRKKLEKERDKLKKQQAELQQFDEKLKHYADKRIKLDLDDGVKVNYGKFGDLLAEVKAVTGGKSDED